MFLEIQDQDLLVILSPGDDFFTVMGLRARSSESVPLIAILGFVYSFIMSWLLLSAVTIVG